MDQRPALRPKQSDFMEWLISQDEAGRKLIVGSSRHSPVDILADTERELYDVVFARWVGRVKGGVHLDNGRPRPGFS